MSIALFVALASASAALLLALGVVDQWHCHRRRRRARRIPHVTAIAIGAAMSNAIVGTPKKFALVYKDAFGVAVDLAKFPTAVSNVQAVVSDGGIASVSLSQDGAECQVTFASEGKVTLTVSAVNKDGEPVSAAVDVVGELPVPKVTAIDIVEA